MANTIPRQPGAGAAAVELLEDWITIWHSELAALVLDRENQESVLRMIDIWASQARASLTLMTSALDAGTPRESARRPAGTDASARAPAAAAYAAFDRHDALIERLSGQLAELERRLARLETPPG